MTCFIVSVLNKPHIHTHAKENLGILSEDRLDGVLQELVTDA
jgi:hypothetical protein